MDPITHDALSFVDYVRIGVSLVFTGLAIRIAMLMSINARNIGKLLEQAQLDHQAREQVVLDLRTTAMELAIKTQAAVEASDKQLHDLSDKMDDSIRIGSAAADASKKAENAANSVNEKIRETNQRLLEHSATVARDTESAVAAEIHDHIDKAIDVGEKTLDKTTSVDKKVDALRKEKKGG